MPGEQVDSFRPRSASIFPPARFPEGSPMISRLRQLVSDEQGNSMIEYGLVCVFISIAAILVLQALAPIVLAFWQQIVDGISTAG